MLIMVEGVAEGSNFLGRGSINSETTELALGRVPVLGTTEREPASERARPEGDMDFELPFERLDVYRAAMELTGVVLGLGTIKGAGEECDQLRRAATSIVHNIAEGCGRDGPDRRRMFMIARGSALECAASLEILKRYGLPPFEHEQARTLAGRIYAMLSRLTGKST
jgi:four helix bundle protein